MKKLSLLNIFVLSIILIFSFQIQAQTCFMKDFSSINGMLFKASGNQYLDSVMTQEYNFLVAKFGVLPDLFYYNDANGSNAYATSEVLNPYFRDGRIAIGFNLIRKECAESISNTCISIAIIMAHEFGHIVDFKYKVQMNNNLMGKKSELFADYLAGCYMHLRSIQYGYTDVQDAAKTFYNMGDYQFNSPLHHGTPQQRLNTLMAGYNYSRSQVMAGYSYTLADAVKSSVNYLSQIP